MSKWISTEHKDISWEHCGQPAYWGYVDDYTDELEVFCSKCQEMLVEAPLDPEHDLKVEE